MKLDEWTLESTPTDSNPNMSGDMAAGSMHFACKLSREGARETLETYYSVGPGIWRRWVAENPNKLRHFGTWTRKEAAQILRTGKFLGRRVIASEELLDHAKVVAKENYRPAAADFLECLLSDAYVLDYDEDQIDDWAEDMGFTKVSEALNCWRVSRSQSAKLRRMCGGDLEPLRALIEAEEERATA